MTAIRRLLLVLIAGPVVVLAMGCSESGNGLDSGSAPQPPWAWLKLSLIETYAFTDFRYFESCEASEEPMPGVDESLRQNSYYLQTWVVSCDTPEGRAAFRVVGITRDVESGTAGSVQPVWGDVAALRVHHWYGCRGRAAVACPALLGEVVRVEPSSEEVSETGFPTHLQIESAYDGSVEGYFSSEPLESWEVGMPFYER